MNRCINSLVLLILPFLSSCSTQKLETIDFVVRNYSNETTEIIDHVIFEILGKNYCFETTDAYSSRTGIEFPEYDAKSESTDVVKQYLKGRRMISGNTTVVVKNVLPSICNDTSYIRALKADVNSDFRDDNTINSDGRTEEFRLNKRQKNMYNKLLTNISIADLSVLEMVNTACLNIKKGTGKERQVPINSKSGKQEQYVDGYLIVSKAVVSDDGMEACLLYEYVSGPKSGIGCIIFVDKVANRWRLVREVMIWIS